MKHIYFHIGMPKTGTTAIQYFLLRNKTKLEELSVGFYTPETGGKRQKTANAYYLFMHFMIEAKVFNFTDRSEIVSMYYQGLREYAKGYNRLILSEEQFWKEGLKRKEIWQFAYDEIHKIIDEECVIHPVVYLRRQDDWILSMWKQTIVSFPFDTWTIDELMEEERTLDFCNYNEKLKDIENVFGSDTIIVRVYDRKQFKGDNILTDFLESIGIEWRDEFVFSEQLYNPSITLDAAHALNLINTGKIVYDKPDDYLRTNLRTAAIVFSKLYPEKASFHFMDFDKRKAFLDKHIDNNQAVADRYNNGKPLFDYTIKPYEVWKHDSDRDIKNAQYIIKLSTLGPEKMQMIVNYINKKLR